MTILVLAVSACQRDPAERIFKFERIQMGTQVQISLVAPDQQIAQRQADNAFNEIERIEDLLSDHRPASDVARINEAAGQDWVTVSDETFGLLELARSISERSEGAFDVTFKGLDLWRFEGATAAPPDVEQIKQRLALVDYRLLELDRQTGSARLARPGMAIGLGGIAKGYAVRKAVERLKQDGCNSGIVNAGGDLYAFGDKLGRPWSVGVQHPRRPSELLATVEVHDVAVVTSGDYERFFEFNGRRYCHIIDPHTGWPATGCQSVTIVAADPTVADAMATAAFVLGPERGMALVRGTSGVEALIVDDQGQCTLSPGADRLGLKLIR